MKYGNIKEVTHFARWQENICVANPLLNFRKNLERQKEAYGNIYYYKFKSIFLLVTRFSSRIASEQNICGINSLCYHFPRGERTL